MADILSVDPEDISTRTPLTKDYDIDPIDIAALVIACEKVFKVTIHDEHVLAFGSLQELAEHIDQLLEAGIYDAPEVSEEDRTAWFYE